ncbi:MAG TPA: hypothetical protein VEF89_09640 [Solirubrobacteraceae bacterium]|nr:hypothetical protein [Solirubrobacteraceae bacterium]
MRGASAILRLGLRPLGYLAFVLALASLSLAAKALGDRDELGFFTDRLARTLWRYPEVTRRGVQVAWLVWAIAFAIACSPFDPLSTPWDEVALAAVAMAVLWRRFVGGHRAER